MFLHEKKEGSKVPLMQLLEKIAEEAVADGSCLIEIYFTGHGELKTGNWVMEKPEQIFNEEIDYTCSLKEVIEILQSKGYNRKLNITTDCCYSGNWCHKAKELVDSKFVQLESFQVFATTSSDRKARWGAYRRLIERSGKENTTP